MPDTSRTAPAAARPLYFILLGLAAAALGGLMIEAGKLAELSSLEMLRDPAAVYDYHAFAGAVSSFGIGLMVAAAAVTLVLAPRAGPGGAGLLRFAGLLSLAIALDDRFLLHERVLPLQTGLPEMLFVAPYALAGLAMPFVAARVLGWRGMAGLWPALVYLALSVVTDFEFLGESSYATEDLLKLGGYGAWAGFWAICATGLALGAARTGPLPDGFTSANMSIHTQGRSPR